MNSQANTPMTQAQALTEASRCLHCYESPCQQGCPAGIDVAKFIRRIATQDFRGAAQVIRRENPLGMICAQVCPSEQLCAKSCSSIPLGGAIKIAALQEFALSQCPGRPRKAAATSGKSVAVVGGGPGGLAAASYLAGRGYAVDLYESSGALGGIPQTQIPGFRLDRDAAGAEIASLLGEGITVHLNTTVDAALAQTIAADHDAVYLSAGLGPKTEGVPMDAGGCLFAEDFLERLARGDISHAELGDDVLVLGGGNTAMDAASAAKRLGCARVSVLYRRTVREMPAWQREYLHAVADGVAFYWQTLVTQVEDESGRLVAVQYAPTAANGTGPDGRPLMEPDLSCQSRLRASTLISALGRGSNRALAEAFGLKTDGRGRIAVDAALQTSHPRIFAGGDLVNGGSTVVQAVADGKRAAGAIHAALAAAKVAATV